jgi:hypothetical protein
VLESARDSHSLVVADCRTVDHPHAPALLSAASHILWTLPATETALRNAEMLKRCAVLPSLGSAREALVVIAIRPAPTVTVRALRASADDRHERLILIPHIADLSTVPDAAGCDEVLSALTQLGTFLRRAA